MEHFKNRPQLSAAVLKLAGVAVLAAALAGSYWWLTQVEGVAFWADPESLRARIDGLGPLAVVGLIAVAIIFSPLPSAPVALAAGALYGHTWGTIYILAGSLLGAATAFTLARWLGYEALRRWFGDKLDHDLLGSQNMLMGIVFVSRLLPFMSFDLISYAAGLTPLRFWRFLAATILGVAPVSFVLAHFGNEMATLEGGRVVVSVLVLGLLTGAPLLVKVWWNRRRDSSAGNQPPR